MTKAKHTPGPWVIGSSEGRVLSHWDGIGYWEIANATVTNFRGDSGEMYFAGGTQEANARLIAAAPDLLEALEGLEGYVEGIIEDGCPKCGGDCSEANPPVSFCPIQQANKDLLKARAAIAKAKGEA